MSFIEQMQKLAIEKNQKNQEIMEKKSQEIAKSKLQHEKRMTEVKHSLMEKLTKRYFMMVKTGIENAAREGRFEKYINFCRDDFKANCNGLGYPNEIQRMWINEMCNPESVYLLTDENGNKMHLQGVNARIWNNGAYTTVFTWYVK